MTKGESEILTKQILKSQETTANTENMSEENNLISQIVISRFLDKTEAKQDTGWGGSRKLPYAFTENGVAMLSSVLRSPLAIQVNIGIMRAFTEFRKIAASLQIPDSTADVAQLRKDFEELKLDIEDILHDQNDINEMTRAQLDAISTALAELQPKEPKPRKKIGFIQEEG